MSFWQEDVSGIEEALKNIMTEALESIMTETKQSNVIN